MKFLSYSLLATCVIGLSACIGAGQNAKVQSIQDGFFPQTSGIDLKGETRAFPEAFDTPLTIVTVAFKRDQQKNVNTWIDTVEPKIEGRSDIDYLELPVIYRMSGMSRFWVNNGMRSGIPDAEARERTITIYTDRSDFLEMLNMNTSTIYTLLVRNDGKILWRTEGDASEEKLADLFNTIEKMQ